MKTTIQSYQNQTKNLQDLTNLELDYLYSTLYDLIGESIENDDIKSHDKILLILKAVKKEIQDRNKVTSPITIKQSNLQIIKTQINQTIKKRTRNSTIFEYALFLHTVKKISTKKLLSMSSKNSNKLNTLKRVYTLLVHERNRLDSVA